MPGPARLSKIRLIRQQTQTKTCLHCFTLHQSCELWNDWGVANINDHGPELRPRMLFSFVALQKGSHWEKSIILILACFTELKIEVSTENFSEILFLWPAPNAPQLGCLGWSSLRGLSGATSRGTSTSCASRMADISWLQRRPAGRRQAMGSCN